MLFLFNAVRESRQYQDLKENIGCTLAVNGVSAPNKCAVVATLVRDLKRRAVIICADEGEQAKLNEDFSSLGVKTVCLCSRDFVFKTDASYSHEYEHSRIGALKNISDGNFEVLLATVDGAMSYTIPPKVLEEVTFTLSVGQSISLSKIEERLVRAGYSRSEMVEGTGTFALRGGILDLFTPALKSPIRIEMWGDSIDNINLFDIQSQRRTTSLSQAQITPVFETVFKSDNEFISLAKSLCVRTRNDKAKAELRRIIDMAQGGIFPKSYDRFLPLAYQEGATLLDYLENEMVFISESAKTRESAKGYHARLNEDIKLSVTEGTLTKQTSSFALSYSDFYNLLAKKSIVYLDTFARGNYDIEIKDSISFDFRQTVPWRTTVANLIEEIRPVLSRGGRVALCAGAEKAAKSLATELKEQGVSAHFEASPDEIKKGSVTVCTGGLSSGFEIPSIGFYFVVRGQKQENKRRVRHKAGMTLNSLDEIKRGDFVVHATHGIGIFEGVHKLTTEGITKDYIKIKYAKEDMLYVPVTQLDLVSKYIGNTGDGALKLNRLGSSEWQNTRKRVKSSLRDIAKELIKLYAERMNAKGYAFSPDGDFQRDFETRFEYEETEDQLRCIEEIKRDMERLSPMDRLLCGDVGFGKTEVALRMAFKAIADGKQVVLLVPTTILAWQHYQTAVRRMEGMPVLVEMLSRFRTPKQQQSIIKRVASGEIDMLIGTHRVLNKEIKFRDLGLVIIDEEQRFGVAQKEKLRQIKPNVDTLTLSATPIPRTLNMAMSGLRDMSSLEQAPADRLPVQTYVTEYDFSLITEVIKRELRRSGQVYYLHNKVNSIEQCAHKIAEAIPEARVATAHGKMTEAELSEVWRRLINGEIDVLVCTTIIETGVDVPNVNTLIIEDADRMGLSQLHQLRGRVGRSSRRAYAYFTYKMGKVVNEVAEKRLEAIREFTEFGSGFKIAMRDLEIRGAGNVLGGEQHGHLDAVGYDMYIKLLSSAIKEEKGEENTDTECTIDLHIEAHIPEKYISSLQARLGIYRSIADVKNEQDAADLMEELTDRFGTPPDEVHRLIEVSQLRNRASHLGIEKIEQHGNMLRLYPVEVNEAHTEILEKNLGKLFSLNTLKKPCYVIRMFGEMTPKQLLSDIISALEK